MPKPRPHPLSDAIGPNDDVVIRFGNLPNPEWPPWHGWLAGSPDFNRRYPVAKVGNRGETHVWFNGEFWSAYTERQADIRRFTEWFGKPSRRGREDACAHWDDLPKDALRIRRRKVASNSTASQLARAEAGKRLREARRAAKDQSV